MSLYPMALNLQGRLCLVVGGGAIAERKVKTLLGYGAQVKVIAPEATPKLQEWAAEGKIIWERRAYAPGDMGNVFLVVGATDSREVNAQVAGESEAQGRLVNVVDDPTISNFLVPSSVQRGALVISVSTSGLSPTLARYLREELEELFGPEYGPFTELLGELRDRLKMASDESRVAAIRRMVREGVLDLIRQGQLEEARKKAIECISN